MERISDARPAKIMASTLPAKLLQNNLVEISEAPQRRHSSSFSAKKKKSHEALRGAGVNNANAMDTKMLEVWLNLMLENSSNQKIGTGGNPLDEFARVVDSIGSNPEAAPSVVPAKSLSKKDDGKVGELQQIGLGRELLLEKGFHENDVERLYRGLYVYSVGFHDFLAEAVSSKADSAQLMLKIWDCYVHLLDRANLSNTRKVIVELEQRHNGLFKSMQEMFVAKMEELHFALATVHAERRTESEAKNQSLLQQRKLKKIEVALQAQISQLNSHVKQGKDEYAELKVLADEQHKLVTERDNEIAKLKEKISQDKTLHHQLVENFNNLQSAKNQLMQEKVKQTGEFKRQKEMLNRLIESLETDKASLTAVTHELSDELKATKGDVVIGQRANDALSLQLSNEQESRRALQVLYDNLQTTHTMVVEEKRRLEKDLQSETDQRQKLSLIASSTAQELELKIIIIADHESTIQRQEEEIAGLKVTKKKLHEQVYQKEQALAEAAVLLEKEQEIVIKTKGQLSTANKKLARSDESLVETKDLLEETKKVCEEYQNVIARLKQENHSLMEEKRAYADAALRIEHERVVMDQERTRWQNQYQLLERKLDSERINAESTAKRLEIEREKVAYLQPLAKSLEDELKHERMTAHSLTNEVGQLGKERSTLSSDMEALRLTKEHLEESEIRLLQVVDQQKELLSQTQKRCEELQVMYDQAKDTIDTDRQLKHKLEMQLSQVSEELKQEKLDKDGALKDYMKALEQLEAIEETAQGKEAKIVAEAEALREQLSQLKSAHQTLELTSQSQLKASEEARETWERSCEVLNESNQYLQTELTAATASVEEFKAKEQELEQQLMHLMQENGEYSERAESAEAKLHKMEHQLEVTIQRAAKREQQLSPGTGKKGRKEGMEAQPPRPSKSPLPGAAPSSAGSNPSPVLPSVTARIADAIRGDQPSSIRDEAALISTKYGAVQGALGALASQSVTSVPIQPQPPPPGLPKPTSSRRHKPQPEEDK